jgi:hypothetical protein
VKTLLQHSIIYFSSQKTFDYSTSLLCLLEAFSISEKSTSFLRSNLYPNSCVAFLNSFTFSFKVAFFSGNLLSAEVASL